MRMRFELREDTVGIVEGVAFVVRVESCQRAIADRRREGEEGERAGRRAQESPTIESRMSLHPSGHDRSGGPASG